MRSKVLLVNSWNAPLDGSGVLLSLKVKRLKPVLKEPSQKYYSNTSSRVRQAT